MRRNGIVLELHPDCAIVLSRDGEFCRIPRTAEMLVGVEVEWEAPVASGRPDRVLGRERLRAPWRRLSIAGMAASLVAAAGVWFGISATRPAQAYASVAVDVNPSVSLEVDRNLRVLSAHGNDAEGAKLLSGLRLQGDPLGVALQDIVRAAGAVGALGSDDAILVSAAPAAGSADLTRVQQAAESALMQLVPAGMKAPHLYTITLSPAIWQAADAAKISPGRLAAYLVAEKEGVHVQSVNDLYGPSLVRVLSDPAAAPVLQVLSAADISQLERFIDSLHLPASGGGGLTGSSNPAKGSANAGAVHGQTANPPGGAQGSGGQNAADNGQGAGQGSGSKGSDGTAAGRQGGVHGSGTGDSGTPGKSSGKHGSGKPGSGNGTPDDDGPGGGGLRVSGSIGAGGEIQVRIGDRVITVPVDSGVMGRLTGSGADSGGKRHGSSHDGGSDGLSEAGFLTDQPMTISGHGWDKHAAEGWGSNHAQHGHDG
ncbi:MAG: anti-sigma factor domain-containing protein [Alicyclobacillus macrosporangiidus]|uniref:anti-sigma factor domain-containing protein n=1 Tax=Alicyclobacillus macrosporangiidus TaxID=392015 RepID=UPI0026F065A3|nr:anti-sigma factor domain-containing protein [Alicyclobacillus macrosporangiidus]MCL6597660.1 anti-sigma factor domain-containing protein [Alicyclobacillus macrosporangiidus]